MMRQRAATLAQPMLLRQNDTMAWLADATQVAFFAQAEGSVASCITHATGCFNHVLYAPAALA